MPVERGWKIKIKKQKRLQEPSMSSVTRMNWTRTKWIKEMVEKKKRSEELKCMSVQKKKYQTKLSVKEMENYVWGWGRRGKIMIRNDTEAKIWRGKSCSDAITVSDESVDSKGWLPAEVEDGDNGERWSTCSDNMYNGDNWRRRASWRRRRTWARKERRLKGRAEKVMKKKHTNCRKKSPGRGGGVGVEVGGRDRRGGRRGIEEGGLQGLQHHSMGSSSWISSISCNVCGNVMITSDGFTLWPSGPWTRAPRLNKGPTNWGGPVHPKSAPDSSGSSSRNKSGSIAVITYKKNVAEEAVALLSPATWVTDFESSLLKDKRRRKCNEDSRKKNRKRNKFWSKAT